MYKRKEHKGVRIPRPSVESTTGKTFMISLILAFFLCLQNDTTDGNFHISRPKPTLDFNLITNFL
jgi:hypothetical protein